MKKNRLLSNDTYFKQNPSHVLGMETTVSTRFGQEAYTLDSIAKRKGSEGLGNYAVEFRDSVNKAVDWVYVEPQVLVPIPNDVWVEPNSIKVNEENLNNSVLETVSARSKQAEVMEGCEKDMLCFDDVIRDYNPQINEDEIRAWVWFQVKDGGLFDKNHILQNGWGKYYDDNPPLDQWFRDGIVAYDGSGFVPSVLYYSGNIYDKIRTLKSQKQSFVSRFSLSEYEVQLEKLVDLIPNKLSITGNENRLYLSPKDDWIAGYTINQTVEEDLEKPSTILYNFMFSYLGNQDASEFAKYGTSAYNIQQYYYWNSNLSSDYSNEEKTEIKRNAEIGAKAMFAKYLKEHLVPEDQERIDRQWNEKHNHYVDIDYDKVPVGFEASKYFKRSLLKIRPAQREGVAFLNAIGSGHIAYDVGVGKTLTSIIHIASGMYAGTFKRPLVVVPKSVYNKWLKEFKGSKDKDGNPIAGLLPQYEVVELGNMSQKYVSKLDVKSIPERCVFLATKEGMMKIGFTEETENSFVREMKIILSQPNNPSLRKKAVIEGSIESAVSSALEKTIVNIEDLGIDGLYLDEAHYYSKSFVDVKGELSENNQGKLSRDKKDFKIKGAPSAPKRSVHTFLLAQYVLKNNNLRNVVGLTATPFQNSPLEIYSMLALVAYKDLESMGLVNIVDFFQQFVDQTVEDKYSHKGVYEAKYIIKSFANLPVLQSVIFKYVNYKSGEDANIKRPEKVVLPRLYDDNGVIYPDSEQISTFIPPTELQKYWFEQIELLGAANSSAQELSELYDKMPKEDGEIKGLDLRIINFSRFITLSPYILDYVPKPQNFDAKTYVESSPKILYSLMCARSVVEYNRANNQPVSGQVLYMNLGVEYFPLIRDYIVEQGWLKREEIKILASKVGDKNREKVIESFLDEKGKVKFIIGSSTILVGVDLQNKASVLYNCDLAWNPTDIRQLEGRIWRFGNIHTHVRIVVPIVENSFDAFLFQKQYEKTQRINNIFQRGQDKSVLDINEFNQEELRNLVVSKPEIRAGRDIKNEKSRLKGKILAIQSKKESYRYFDGRKMTYERERKTFEEMLQKAIDFFPKEKNEIENDKQAIRLVRKYVKSNYTEGYWQDTELKKLNSYVRALKNYKRLIKKLEKDGIEADKLKEAMQKMDLEKESLQARIDSFEDGKYLEVLTKKYQKEIDERPVRQQTLEKAVSEFKETNHLLSCTSRTGKICSIKGIIGQKPVEKKPDRRITIAKAKAKALAMRIRLRKRQQMNQAA